MCKFKKLTFLIITISFLNTGSVFSQSESSNSTGDTVNIIASATNTEKVQTSTREQLKSLFKDETEKGLSVEYIEFEDKVYSRSRKTEIGDQVELETSLRYQYKNNTYARFRFITDPEETNLDNKTSKFEFVLHHEVDNWGFQLDLDFLTNDESTGTSKGATSIGPDLDSVGTFVTYRLNDFMTIGFYPYNFDGVVGNEFNTYDVTRIHYITGSPATVDTAQANNEELVSKSIPGINLTFTLTEKISAYVGAGIASYLYPTSPNFDVNDNTLLTADSWERKEDIGYRFGALIKTDHAFVKFEHVAHDEANETGALLKAATSLYGNFSMGSIILAGEITRSHAGEKAYNIDGKAGWFKDNTSPYSAVYADYFGESHNWLGKKDTAFMFKAGFGVNDEVVPYLSFKRQGEHFIYRERDSAHTLRNFDETLSHGGLNRFGLGAHFYSGKYQIKPQVEYFVADNPVFSNSTDVRNDRFNANLKKTDYLFSIVLRYSFGEYRQFRPY